MGEFGVAVNPFEIEDWTAATGILPDFTMLFEAWSMQRALTDVCNKAISLGHRSIAVTWEPWTPTPVGATPEQSAAVQAEWTADTILAGEHDDYIDAVARSLRDSKLNVYLRLAHEMNGTWYPWSADPAGYVDAWKYIRYRMRSMRGAWNVKMVWSPNYDLWRVSPADWLARLLPYWPGPAAIDGLGTTMIDFGGTRDYPVSSFADRFALAWGIFARRTKAMECNVDLADAADWFTALAEYIVQPDRPLNTVIFSQGNSRASALGGTGNLSWQLPDHPELVPVVEAVIGALHAF